MATISAITNLGALQGIAALNSASQQMNQSLERLSTGKKINRASDDPAGLQTVEQLKARLAAINSRIDTIDFQEHYFGARDGAESVVGDLLLRLQSDVTSAANTSAITGAEKQALQDDATSVLKTIDFLSQTTTFNGEQILTGFHTTNLGTGVVTRPQDPNTDDGSGGGDGGGGGNGPPSRDAAPPSYYSLADLAQGGDLNLVDGDLDSAQKIVTQAVNAISTDRAGIGTELKSLDSEKQGLMVEMENTESARSDIEDTDYAAETSKLVRAQILREVSLYVTQLAEKQQSDTVLKLIG